MLHHVAASDRFVVLFAGVALHRAIAGPLQRQTPTQAQQQPVIEELIATHENPAAQSDTEEAPTPSAKWPPLQAPVGRCIEAEGVHIPQDGQIPAPGPELDPPQLP